MTDDTPLPTKLGIKEGHRVALLGAPAGFRRTLGRLPHGVELTDAARRTVDVAILFVAKGTDLSRRFPVASRHVETAGGLWVAWPKKASEVNTDLSFDIVQRTGLDAGLVDNKSCSVDGTWQALRFVVRLGDR
ncbi:MAG TPA: DUF3052 domain-containing protein [Actinomycetota bacterium]|jgi:hypothetical protein